MPRGTVQVGISGWTYPPWRGVFYPKGLPQRRELEYASRRLTSIEVNGSFYALQKPESWQTWRAETPDGFVFAVKGGRFITHMKKLNDVEVPLANFLASGMLALGDKLGPMLWQLPPNLGFHAGRIADFLDLLRARDVAVVTADTAGKWPVFLEPTASLAYVRLHGDEELYVSGYDAEALDRWAARVAGWRDEGRDVVVYFDNDAKVRAPVDAMALMARLGIEPLP